MLLPLATQPSPPHTHPPRPVLNATPARPVAPQILALSFGDDPAQDAIVDAAEGAAKGATTGGLLGGYADQNPGGDEPRSAEYADWLDGGTGQMGDLAPR